MFFKDLFASGLSVCVVIRLVCRARFRSLCVLIVSRVGDILLCIFAFDLECMRGGMMIYQPQAPNHVEGCSFYIVLGMPFPHVCLTSMRASLFLLLWLLLLLLLFWHDC